MKYIHIHLLSFIFTFSAIGGEADFQEISPEQEERLVKRKAIEAQIIKKTKEEIRSLQGRQAIKKSSDSGAFGKWLSSKGSRSTRKPSSVPTKGNEGLTNLPGCKRN